MAFYGFLLLILLNISYQKIKIHSLSFRNFKSPASRIEEKISSASPSPPSSWLSLSVVKFMWNGNFHVDIREIYGHPGAEESEAKGVGGIECAKRRVNKMINDIDKKLQTFGGKETLYIVKDEFILFVTKVSMVTSLATHSCCSPWNLVTSILPTFP